MDDHRDRFNFCVILGMTAVFFFLLMSSDKCSHLSKGAKAFSIELAPSRLRLSEVRNGLNQWACHSAGGKSQEKERGRGEPQGGLDRSCASRVSPPPCLFFKRRANATSCDV